MNRHEAGEILRGGDPAVEITASFEMVEGAAVEELADDVGGVPGDAVSQTGSNSLLPKV